MSWIGAENCDDGDAPPIETHPVLEGDEETVSEKTDEANTDPGTETDDPEQLKQKRKEFETVTRPEYWKKKAAESPGGYSESDLERMRNGKPPIGSDGNPMELHHKTPLSRGGSNDVSNLEEMTRTRHRLGGNYRVNHPAG